MEKPEEKKSPLKSSLKVIEFLSLLCQSKINLLCWLGKFLPFNYPFCLFSPTASIFFAKIQKPPQYSYLITNHHTSLDILRTSFAALLQSPGNENHHAGC